MTSAMFLKLPLLLLSVIAVARFGLCQNTSSFNDLVNRFPKCSRSCFHDFFDDLYADTCGDVQSSNDLEDIACLCGDGPKDEMEYSEEVLTPCLQDSCPEVDPEDANDFLDPMADWIKWCSPAIEEYGGTSEPSGNSGPKFGSGSIFAFGVVLFSVAFNS